jgi:hypothetical protein
VIGLFGATVGAVFAAFPQELVLAIAGLALLDTIGNSLAAALTHEFLGILPVRCDFCKESNERTGGENILAQPLQPEESRRITIAAGTTCLSNIKVVFANRTSRGHENVDVCNLGGITHGN